MNIRNLRRLFLFCILASSELALQGRENTFGADAENVSEDENCNYLKASSQLKTVHECSPEVNSR